MPEALFFLHQTLDLLLMLMLRQRAFTHARPNLPGFRVCSLGRRWILKSMRASQSVRACEHGPGRVHPAEPAGARREAERILIIRACQFNFQR